MQVYMVIELQKTNNTMSAIPTSFTDLNAAYAKFHTVAAAAAISQIEKHSVIIVNDDGFELDRATFEHEVAAE